MTTLTSVAAVAAQTLANMTKSSQMYSRAATSEPSNSSKTIIISTSDTEANDNGMTKRSSLSPTGTLSAPRISSQLLRTLTENAKPDSDEILEDEKRNNEMNPLKYNSVFEQTGSGKRIRYLDMNNDGMSSVPDAENEGGNSYLEKHNNIPSGKIQIYLKKDCVFSSYIKAMSNKFYAFQLYGLHFFQAL
jgi:hypothetical protein